MKNQTNQEENGIYVLTQEGDVSNPAILTRAPDYDQVSEIKAGGTVVIISGATLEATNWMMSQTAPITIGTTPITWQQVSASGSGNPGGNNGSMQYNAGGLFGGDDNITTDGAGNQEIDGSLTVDNLLINNTHITNKNTDGDVNIEGSGTGHARIHGIAYPKSDGVANAVMQTDGAGNLSLNPLGDLKGLTLISDTLLTSNTLDIRVTNLPATRNLRIYVTGFESTVNGVYFRAQMSQNNGATYLTTPNTVFSHFLTTYGGNISAASYLSLTYFPLAPLVKNNDNISSIIDVCELGHVGKFLLSARTSYSIYSPVDLAETISYSKLRVSAMPSSNPINALRFFFTSPGLIKAGGRIRVYAI